MSGNMNKTRSASTMWRRSARNENLRVPVAHAANHELIPSTTIATNGQGTSMLADLDRLLMLEESLPINDTRAPIGITGSSLSGPNVGQRGSHVADTNGVTHEYLPQKEVEDDWILVGDVVPDKDLAGAGSWMF